ncbi:DNA recombination protein RecF [Anoxybacter fermentans]|uniref:DNA replication and repair protein RecF n=1 Tax=Anoxybacter fermentans TaxID=1323375 RepID=A0A3Q9HSD6_9FIRM|nr:DNA replication/repair protein RecF [Anoxybacter fermentans]AZR74306.1 DNA recombination protein RecF [Anoxybacter fermentans]
MYVKRIYLKNYRNIKEADLSFDSSLNLFIGANAQGKTNILESIYLLGTGTSHRTNRDINLIHWGKDYFYIKSSIIKRNREITISFGYDGSKKEIKVDNNPIHRISDLMGYVNVVIFSPEDLQLVKGGPIFRRRFLNLDISQVNPYYFHNLQKYNQVVKQRNLLLKEIREGKKVVDLLFVWNQQLTDLGSRLIKKRLEVVEKIDILARLVHRRITDGRENLKLKYESSIGEISNQMTREEIKEIFENRLKKEQENEISRGVSLFGPHRDDLELTVNGINVRQFGSQGQQRTTALALKIAELEYMKSEMGEYPILLLDDVFSELDAVRKSQLLEVIRDKIQTFITSTDLDSLEEINGKYRLFYINDGQVVQKKGSE